MVTVDPDKIDAEMRALANGVRNSTIDACIKIIKLSRDLEEAERMVAKLRAA